MSALPPKAGIGLDVAHVCLVPKSGLMRRNKIGRSSVLSIAKLKVPVIAAVMLRMFLRQLSSNRLRSTDACDCARAARAKG